MPDLEFPRSDGNKQNVPQAEHKAVLVPLSDTVSITWRRKVGIEVATALEHEKPRTYSLAKFPENYAFYRFVRTKGPGSDLYLYGATGKRFRSAAEFAPHAIWLFKDESLSPANCQCKYCAGPKGARRTSVAKPKAALKSKAQSPARKKTVSPKFVKNSDVESEDSGSEDEESSSESAESTSGMTDLPDALKQVMTSFTALQGPMADCVRLLGALSQIASSKPPPAVKKARRPKEMMDKQKAAQSEPQKKSKPDSSSGESEEESESETSSNAESGTTKPVNGKEPSTSAKVKESSKTKEVIPEVTVKKAPASSQPVPPPKAPNSGAKKALPPVQEEEDDESSGEEESSSGEEESESESEEESDSSEEPPAPKPKSNARKPASKADQTKAGQEVKKGTKRAAGAESEAVVEKPRSKRLKV